MSDWLPQPEEVAALLPQRFFGEGPSEDTIPTVVQVTQLIGDRAVDVRNRCGRIDSTGDNDIIAYAKQTVALGAAAYISQQFFPEQQDNSEEQRFLRMRYDEHIEALRRQVLYRHMETRGL